MILFLYFYPSKHPAMHVANSAFLIAVSLAVWERGYSVTLHQLPERQRRLLPLEPPDFPKMSFWEHHTTKRAVKHWALPLFPFAFGSDLKIGKFCSKVALNKADQ